MKFLSNLHTHSIFSDGADNMSTIVDRAVDKGFVSLGFSDHAPLVYDTECSMSKNRVDGYLAEIEKLKKAYDGIIEIYTGIESDALELFDKSRLDYTIGSVHFIQDEDKTICIDSSADIFKKALCDIASNDPKVLVRNYFNIMEKMLKEYVPDILGHFDIYTKFNENNVFFDEDATWHKRLQEEMVEKIAKIGCIVEINTGGIKRGYRKRPYPSTYALNIMKDMNVAITLSSDAHAANDLDYLFDDIINYVYSIGFKNIKMLKGGKFFDIEL